MNYVKGQVITCKTPHSTERFKVQKVCRKYVYFVSDQYSSDGRWRGLKDQQSDIPQITRF